MDFLAVFSSISYKLSSRKVSKRSDENSMRYLQLKIIVSSDPIFLNAWKLIKELITYKV